MIDSEALWEIMEITFKCLIKCFRFAFTFEYARFLIKMLKRCMIYDI